MSVGNVCIVKQVTILSLTNNIRNNANNTATKHQSVWSAIYRPDGFVCTYVYVQFGTCDICVRLYVDAYVLRVRVEYAYFPLHPIAIYVKYVQETLSFRLINIQQPLKFTHCLIIVVRSSCTDMRLPGIKQYQPW